VADVLATGLDNVSVCVPFVRTLDELRAVKRAVADAGLVGAPGFELWAMAEVPSTALLAERFAAEVDGLSVGSNDLTQLVLGVDRDSAAFSGYDAEDEAVLAAVALVVAGAHAAGIPVCSCGDAPSRSPALVARLVDLGVDRISVPPTAFADTVAAVDAALAAGARP
jgi:pyruvate,water dikinase